MYLIFPRVKNVIKSHTNKRAKRPAIPVCHVEFLRVTWLFLSSICSLVCSIKQEVSLICAYWPRLGQCLLSRILSRSSDRRFAASIFQLAASIHLSHVSLDCAHGQLVPSLCWMCFTQVVGT